VPGVVGKYAEVKHLVRQRGRVVVAVSLAYSEEHEQPCADAAHGRAFDLDRGFVHPLYHGPHAREGYYTPPGVLRYDSFVPGRTQRSQEEEPFMTYVIAEPCVNTKDTACVEVCPVDCIHPKKDAPEFAAETKLYIDPETCIDCGACVPVCPVQAIFPQEELPEKWAQYTQIDADWYAKRK
jgi:NAD-dependent dihydropyrimidine dehydrogenase PreA subunit